MSIAELGLPLYRDLPVAPGLPPGSSWHLFGERDQIGTLNLLTADRVAAGAALVTEGSVFPLNWDLEQPDPSILGRRPMRHSFIRLDGGFDESYDSLNPQSSSQWDALAHVEHPQYGFYNGFSLAEVGREDGALGIDNWAKRGIAGPYLLVDVARYRAQAGRPLDHFRRDEITVDDLEGALAAQGVSRVEPGSILLIHYGWISWYEGLDDAQREDLGRTEMFPCPGLASEPRTIEWLWDHGFAAIVCDNPSVEAMPFDKASDETFLHFKLVALLGMAFGEMHDLRALAADSARGGVYRGLFTAAPMNKRGGSGSMANALALK